MLREGEWETLGLPQFPQIFSRGKIIAPFIKLFAVWGRIGCYEVLPAGVAVLIPAPRCLSSKG